MKFRMVDRILDWQPRKSIRGLKTVSLEEYHLPTALGQAPALPHALITEGLFQLGNWLIVLTSDFEQMGLLVRVEHVRYVRALQPGHRALLAARVRSYRDDGIVFDGRAYDGPDLLAEGRGCLAAPVPLADYYDPDDLRALAAELIRPAPACPEVPWPD